MGLVKVVSDVYRFHENGETAGVPDRYGDNEITPKLRVEGEDLLPAFQGNAQDSAHGETPAADFDFNQPLRPNRCHDGLNQLGQRRVVLQLHGCKSHRGFSFSILLPTNQEIWRIVLGAQAIY